MSLPVQDSTRIVWRVEMGQQAIVIRTGFDEEREVNKWALNALISNTFRTERLNVIELT
jgi:hypothetical protein